MLFKPGKALILLCVLGVVTLSLTAIFIQINASNRYERRIKSHSAVELVDEYGIDNEKVEKDELIPASEDKHIRDPIGQTFQDVEPTKEAVKLIEFLGKVVYNRVGKCGSRSMLTIISKLAEKKNFTFYSSPISNRSKPTFLELLEEVKTINNLPTYSLYSRHIHYIDFAKYGVVPPVYINMVRDPIERFTSQYYFQRYGDNIKAQGRHSVEWREGEKSMDINNCILLNHPTCSSSRLFYIIPYFCGQDILCQRPSVESLERAKVHLMENYFLVGYLEDFEGMLRVLEKTLPMYFDGSVDIWNAVSNNTRKLTSTLRGGAINSTAYAVLKKRMSLEYIFYNFVKSRFMILKRQMGLVDTTVK